MAGTALVRRCQGTLFYADRASPSGCLTPLSCAPIIDGSIDVPGHPNDYPSETITISMASGAEKLGDAGKLRPWLQDFTLGGMSAYGAAEVRAQIDAAEAAGTSGWMVWDPNNEYHADAFAPTT